MAKGTPSFDIFLGNFRKLKGKLNQGVVLRGEKKQRV